VLSWRFPSREGFAKICRLRQDDGVRFLKKTCGEDETCSGAKEQSNRREKQFLRRRNNGIDDRFGVDF
jgi:hypothetical protein